MTVGFTFIHITVVTLVLHLAMSIHLHFDWLTVLNSCLRFAKHDFQLYIRLYFAS